MFSDRNKEEKTEGERTDLKKVETSGYSIKFSATSVPLSPQPT